VHTGFQLPVCSQVGSERNVLEEMKSGVKIQSNPHASRPDGDGIPSGHVQPGFAAPPLIPSQRIPSAAPVPSVVPTPPAPATSHYEERDGGDGLRTSATAGPAAAGLNPNFLDEDYLDPDLDLDIDGMNMDDEVVREHYTQS